MAVKEAAKLLGVGRPALSNLLNGNAALSSEMAARLEKVFGADAQELLKLQAEFDQFQQRSIAPKLPIGAYVPPFLKITAKNIENWAEGNLEARSLFAVLLRKLVNSTGLDLTFVDFPGYDEAERKGWDGRVGAGAATPWIPLGESRWEFGCNKNPKGKADGDYAQRIKDISPDERAKMTFVFVTPRNWTGKQNWIKEKQALGDWKSVRAYDASDIEQWLEQSLQAQRWLSEKLDIPFDGVYSLDERWHAWASVADPELSKELFAPSVEHFKKTVKDWIENSSPSPLIICGDSKIEVLAFLYCMFEEQETAFINSKDRLLVFSSGQALRKLTATTPTFIPIVFTDEAEKELGGEYKNRHVIIVRPRNTVDPEPIITLDLLRYEPFRKALEAMGIKDHHRIDELGRESGYSPTILRRRLSKVPAIRTPEWAEDNAAVRRLIPIMLVGAWHRQSKGDCEVMHVLAGKSSDEIEKDLAEMLKFDDPPVWSTGKFRGVASKIDAFFAVQAHVTQKDLDDFFVAAEFVLSEKDPALDLPEDKRAFASLYGKSREYSGALREGICETLVFLAVHGNKLFKRLGMDVRECVDKLIRDLLVPLTPGKLFSQTGSLPLYAEAAPQEFIRIIEEDLRSPEPQVYALMKPVDTGIFGSCPRTGLLWALENLAWNPDHLPHVSVILANLSERKINDNWVNKPENSLQAIYRSWMPQTAASLEDRKKALEVLVRQYPVVGWKVCVAQFAPRQQIGEDSHRPRWRSDASGAGQPLKTWGEVLPFRRKAIDLVLAWPSHNEKTLSDLIANLQGLEEEEDQQTVWNLVEKWALTETDEHRKVALRDEIHRFALASRGVKQALTPQTRDRARKAYNLLTPTDVVAKNLWLFAQAWVPELFDEPEILVFDYQKHEEKLRNLRVTALQEIWQARGIEGIKSLLALSGAASTVGFHLADGVISSADADGFIEQCLKIEDPDLQVKLDEAIRGFLLRFAAPLRSEITKKLAGVLPPDMVCRLLKASPFQHDTWEQVDAQGAAIRAQYWCEVEPNWLTKGRPDLNEVIDRLLDARRPRAAFHAVHFAFEEVESSRLRRLLQEVGTCDTEAPGVYRIHPYDLSQAFDILQKRASVSEEEMARLEFLFIRALEHQPHGISNLEKQLGKSPALFVQVLALLFRRNDGGEDPPEWRVEDTEKASALGTAAFHLLWNFRRIPGTDENGKINEDKLRTWVKDAQSLCVLYGRAEIGDQKIGEVLSAPIFGPDGIWPCEEVRNVLEECGTPDMATGVQIGVYNSRGVHARAQEGGIQERALAEKYRNWSRKLAFEHPYVANLVEGIAESYDQQAAMWDSEDAVQRRFGN